MKRILSFLTLAAISVALWLPRSAHSQAEIYIKGAGKLFPLAVPQLCLKTGQGEGNKEIPKILARDLDLSGYFEILNPNSYIEAPGKCAGPDGFAYSDWTVIGAEGLVRGEVEHSGSDLKVRMYLHDVQRRTVVLGKEYEGSFRQVPMIAHRFANEIMKFFTGQPGVFGTQIAFSSRIGRFKELFVMDMDGSNVRQLTNDRGLAVSSSWSPAGEHLLYTSYRNRVPELFRVDLERRRVKQLTDDRDLELGAVYTRDGRYILASRTMGSESDIVLYRPDGSIFKRLTPPNGAIDVSPDFSPDESKIAFCSSRSGGPQIYVMNADGSGVQRISYVTSNYCTSPSWSPRGDRIAFVCRADSGHQIFVADPDGTNALQLTSVGNNEDPDWSPDGRYIVFATTFGRTPVFNLALMRDDGSNIRQLTNSRSGDHQPSWGPLTY